MPKGYEPNRPSVITWGWLAVFFAVLLALGYYSTTDDAKNRLRPTGLGPGMCVGC